MSWLSAIVYWCPFALVHKNAKYGCKGTKKKRIMQGKSKKNVALLLLEKTPVRQDLRGKDPL
jgi:hypothetical protein